MDWLDLLTAQGTLKSLLQHHNSKASILLLWAFFMVQLSHPCVEFPKRNSDPESMETCRLKYLGAVNFCLSDYWSHFTPWKIVRMRSKENKSWSQANQSWVFIGSTDVEAETPVLWPPDAKSWLIGKDPDAGKDWWQEEKGMTEDEMVGWHHRLNGHGFGWTLGVGDGQGVLACCSSWGRKESDTTERLNWTELRCQVKKKVWK